MRRAGGGGLLKLRGELEAENSGVSVLAEARWLGGARVRARSQREKSGTSSVVAAVLGEAPFGRLCKSGVRLPGGRHEVEVYEEARPDAFCSRCSGWGHIAPHCEAAVPRCSICAGNHTTIDHRCPVEGRRAKKGRPCPHGTAECAGCGGPTGRGPIPAPPRRMPAFR